MNMKVYELLEKSGVTPKNPLKAPVVNMNITGISESSLRVADGHLFVAISDTPLTVKPISVMPLNAALA